MKSIVKENYKLVVSGSIIIGLMLIMGIIWINKGTFSVDEVENGLVISCPGAVSPGEEVTCGIKANVKNTTVTAINAKYNQIEGLVYKDFALDNNSTFSIYANEEAGFAVVDLEGITENVALGIVKVVIPTDALPNEKYKIGLTEIEYSDKEQTYSIEDAMIEVRVKNNIATLDNILVEGYELDKEFNKDTLEYNIEVDSSVDKIKISYVKTDENAQVSGNGAVGSDINLNYGTNKLNIKVDSEDGKVTNTYIVNVKRNYDFSTSVYLYDKDNNYIYTRSDEGVTITSNLEKLPEGLSYKIENNKLNILYIDEVVKSIDIINFSSGYSIVDGKFYIEKDLTYGAFLDRINIDDDKLKLLVVDSNDQEISNVTIIDNEKKAYVYYDNKKIDTITFVDEYLRLDNSLIVDSDKFMIKRLVVGTTYEELFGKIDTNCEIEIISNDGSNITKDDILKTNDKIKIKLSSGEVIYTLSILGDLTGDGEIRINDVAKLYRRLKHPYDEELNDVEYAAGDTVNDGNIVINDVAKLYRKLKHPEEETFK